MATTPIDTEILAEYVETRRRVLGSYGAVAEYLSAISGERINRDTVQRWAKEIHPSIQEKKLKALALDMGVSVEETIAYLQGKAENPVLEALRNAPESVLKQALSICHDRLQSASAQCTVAYDYEQCIEDSKEMCSVGCIVRRELEARNVSAERFVELCTVEAEDEIAAIRLVAKGRVDNPDSELLVYIAYGLYQLTGDIVYTPAYLEQIQNNPSVQRGRGCSSRSR